MKGLYIAPELEIVKFLNDDILTASLTGKEEGSGGGADDEDPGFWN